MRTLAGTIAFTLVFGVAIAIAGISHGDDENDYEGKIQNINGTYFGFDLNNSKTKVKGITGYVGFECDNNDVVYTLVEADGSLNLDGANQFSGKVERVEGDLRVKYDVKGGLVPGGKAKGRLKGTYEDPFYETPCKTGKVTWLVKRRSDVEVR